MSSFDDDDTRAVYTEKDEDGQGMSSVTRGVRRTVREMKQNIERSVDSVRMWTWRQWLRPVFCVCYSLVACGALGVMIWDMYTNYRDNRFAAAMWMSAGACALFAIGVSCYHILSHVVYFSHPNQQRYIVRILLMVPIYCIDISIALRVPASAIILDSIRACYQAFVVYCFLFYLLHYLSENYDLDSQLASKPQMKSPKPFCCFKPGPNSKLVYRCRNGVLNFVIIGPLTTMIYLILYYASEDYTTGSFAVTGAWLWVTIVSAISQIWAMYCLAIFYQATKEETKPLRPLPQMLCVKFAIFGSFFQQVAIALLIDLEVIKYPPEWGYSKSTFASTVHNFCIGFEMALVSVIHLYAFTHKPYKNDEPLSFRPSCRSLCDYSDMKDDIRVHSGRFLQSMKKLGKDRRDSATDEGGTALRVMNGDKPLKDDVMGDKPYYDDVITGSITSMGDGTSQEDETKRHTDRNEELKITNGGLTNQSLEVPNKKLEQNHISGTGPSVNAQSVNATDAETFVLNSSKGPWNPNVQDHPTLLRKDTDVDEFGMSKSFEVTAPSTAWPSRQTLSLLEDAFSDISYDKEASSQRNFLSEEPRHSHNGFIYQSLTHLEPTQSENNTMGYVRDILDINMENNIDTKQTDQSLYTEVHDVNKDPLGNVSIESGNEKSKSKIHETPISEDFHSVQEGTKNDNNELTFSSDVDPFTLSSDC